MDEETRAKWAKWRDEIQASLDATGNRVSVLEGMAKGQAVQIRELKKELLAVRIAVKRANAELNG